jgi:hypothetical protein
MSLPAFSRRLLTWIALGLAAGCGSENNDEVFGIDSLVGVEGSPLPYLESSDAECDEFITLGELRLFEQGTYSLELTGTFDCTRGGGQTGTTDGSIAGHSLNMPAISNLRLRSRALAHYDSVARQIRWNPSSSCHRFRRPPGPI